LKYGLTACFQILTCSTFMIIFPSYLKLYHVCSLNRIIKSVVENSVFLTCIYVLHFINFSGIMATEILSMKPTFA
jgi:ABC-type enterochelin transport system ATPase subunit